MEKLKTENVDLYMANDTITESIQKLNEEIVNLKTKNDHLEQINLECTTLKEQYNDLVRTKHHNFPVISRQFPKFS
jgi:gluconate kinase